MSDFGDRLRKLRRQRGFKNQTVFAQALDVHQSQVSQWERFTEPRYEILIKIADLLKTTTEYLTGRTDDPEPPLTLSGYERDMIAWSRGQGHALTNEDFLNYRLDRHPDNPKLIDPGQTPKLTSGSER